MYVDVNNVYTSNYHYHIYLYIYNKYQCIYVGMLL